MWVVAFRGDHCILISSSIVCINFGIDVASGCQCNLIPVYNIPISPILSVVHVNCDDSVALNQELPAQLNESATAVCPQQK